MTTVDNPPARASVQVNGRRISYLEWGAAHQPAMVLLHGGNSAAADWEMVAAAFADRFRVIAPDLRGRGFSDWDPSQDYTVGATMADVEALRAQLGLDHLVLAGDRPAIVDEFHLQLAQNHFARQPDGSATRRAPARVSWNSS
jgi:hypothetical protein